MAIDLAYPFDDADDQTAKTPFSEGVINGRYFSNELYELNLNKLLHLAPYSDLLIITGDYGIGKTTLLEQFSNKAADTWRTALVPCVESEPDTDLLLKIIEHIEMPLVTADESKGILIDSLVRFLESLGRSGRRAFVVLDDAQNLSNEQLNMLGSLLEDYRVDGAISLILVAQPGIDERVNRVESLHQHLKYSFELTPLENTATIFRYIAQRLEAAGATDKLFLFTPEVIQEIALHSEGLPGRINALAKNVLSAKKINPVSADDTKKGGRWALISAGILSIVLVLLFQDDINQAVEPIHNTGEQLNLIALAKQDALAPSPSLQELELPSPASFEKTPLSPLPQTSLPAPNPIADIAATVVTVEPTEKTPPRQLPHRAIKNEVAERVVSADAPIPETTPTPPPEAVVTPAPPVTVKKSPPLSTEHKWLMAQNAENYTLQLMALRDDNKIHEFVKKHKIAGKSAIFYVQRKTGRLSILIYGSYSSAEQAKNAGKKLPKSWGIKRPWARSFAGVKTEFKKNN